MYQVLKKLFHCDDLDEFFYFIPTQDECDDIRSLLFDSSLLHFHVIYENSFFGTICLVLKEKKDVHTVVINNMTDFMKRFTEISQVIDQGEIDAMDIDKTHTCCATILSAFILSLDPGDKHILFLPSSKEDMLFESICMCVQDGFFMFCTKYPTKEELSVLSSEVALIIRRPHKYGMIWFGIF